MKNRVGLWIWIVVLVGFLGGSAFVGYKLWKREQIRAEMERWEVKMVVPLPPEAQGGDLEPVLAEFNGKLQRYEVLRPVIDELDLIQRWGVAGPEEAMAQLKESVSFRDSGEPGKIHFVASDKSKELAQQIGQAVARSFDMALQRDRALPPPMPAGYSE